MKGQGHQCARLIRSRDKACHEGGCQVLHSYGELRGIVDQYCGGPKETVLG